MSGRRPPISDDFDDPESFSSPYDPPDDPDLWFMPDPEPDEPPQALAKALDWAQAQGVHAAALARAALAVGQLDMLVAAMGRGATARLAIREVEALSWAAGTPVSAEEIGRDQLQARAGTDVEALHLARWAVRRLTGDGSLDDLRGFLGLHRSAQSDHAGGARLRMTGEVFDDTAAGFFEALAGFDAHELTRGAYARHLWRLMELSPPENQIEAHVWAARHMASGCQALNFVPMGQGARRARGSDIFQLEPHFRLIERGATSARGELDALRGWAKRTGQATARIKGDNPARIVTALIRHPVASTEMIEQGAGISRATAERLLARMQNMGLVREITGARRFRIWAARV